MVQKKKDNSLTMPMNKFNFSCKELGEFFLQFFPNFLNLNACSNKLFVFQEHLQMLAIETKLKCTAYL